MKLLKVKSNLNKGLKQMLQTNIYCDYIDLNKMGKSGSKITTSILLLENCNSADIFLILFKIMFSFVYL